MLFLNEFSKIEINSSADCAISSSEVFPFLMSKLKFLVLISLLLKFFSFTLIMLFGGFRGIVLNPTSKTVKVASISVPHRYMNKDVRKVKTDRNYSNFGMN